MLRHYSIECGMTGNHFPMVYTNEVDHISTDLSRLMVEPVCRATPKSKDHLIPISNYSKVTGNHEDEYMGSQLSELRATDRKQAAENMRSTEYLTERKLEMNFEQRIQWLKYINTKWFALHELHQIRAAPKHRFSKSLENAFSKATPCYDITCQEYIRSYMNNYAFDRYEREKCIVALDRIFVLLDENFDGLLDWRDFVTHMRILEHPKRTPSKKAASIFDLYADVNGLITVGQMWQIVRTVALEHQRPLVAGFLAHRYSKYVSNPPLHHPWEDFKDKLQVRLDELANAKPTALSAQLRIEQDISISETNVLPQGLTSSFITKKVFEKILFDEEPGGNGLDALLTKLLWDRQPDSIKTSILFKEQEAAATRFKIINQKVRWMEAKAWWRRNIRPNILLSRFTFWKEYSKNKLRARKGMNYYLKRIKMNAIETLIIRTEENVFSRWRNQAADRFCRRIRKSSTFRSWICFLEKQRHVLVIQSRKATLLYQAVLCERILFEWRTNATLVRRIREMIKKREFKMKLSHVGMWKYNVRRMMKAREQENEKSVMRQMMLKQELDETDAHISQMKRAREEAEREEREEEERCEEERRRQETQWEIKREKAHAQTERRNKLKRQEDERMKHKTELNRHERDTFNDAWDGIESKVIADAKKEAEIYACTSEGKEEMRVVGESIMNDAANMQRKGTAGEDTESDWVKMFDPLFDTHFFYNPETGEKVMANSLTMEESLKIAQGEYIAKQIKLAEEEVKRLRQRELDQKQLVSAGKKLQAVWKTKKARMLVYELIKKDYLKRIDPYTGKAYYYNVKTRKSSWEKPVSLGKKELRVCEWNIRYDDTGTIIYENRVSPWLSSPIKPCGYIPCLVCTIQLSAVQCSDCNLHYCLDCFEQAHPLRGGEPHQFQRCSYENIIKATPLSCVMCKDATASKYCVECGLREWYCGKCYNLSHGINPKRPNKLTTKQQHAPPLEF